MTVTTPDPRAELAEVERRVGAAKTSFFAAMRMLPKPRRQAMYAIYVFCREVDDIADEPAPQEEKQAGLALWRREIEAIYSGALPTKPLARALMIPIANFRLRKQDFLAVIDGMAMDAERDIRAPGLEELDLYCDRVASAVGRLSVRAFGSLRPEADEVATHLGRALQLTNILRDIDEDGARGRLYLPREILSAHGILAEVPEQVLADPGLDGACRDLARMARDHFIAAEAAMAQCERAAMRPARVMGAVYAALLERLIARGFAAPRVPVSLPTWRKLWIAVTRGLI
jgi:phytoene synthase